MMENHKHKPLATFSWEIPFVCANPFCEGVRYARVFTEAELRG